MSGIDYEELIRSPLDDIESSSGGNWGIAVIGAVVGLGVGLLMSGLGAEPVDVPTTTVPPATTTAAPAAITADYPADYTEILPGLAVRPEELILGEDSITVAFSSVVLRGEDPALAHWPVGGTWLLESQSGTIVESDRMVIGSFSPGSFAVTFPGIEFNGETSFALIRLIEILETESFEGSAEIAFTEEPFRAPDPVIIPVTTDITLIVPTLELGRFLGAAEWQVSGADLGATVQLEATLLDAESAVIGSYRRFPEVREPSTGATIEIQWSERFPTDQEGAVTVSLDYNVGVVAAEPSSIVFDLAAVPVGR